MKKLIAICVVCLTLMNPVRHAEAGWTTIHKPGASSTIPCGIDSDNIVGTYRDSTGRHGFLYNGTTWITLDKPGASETIPRSIDGDNIVGTYISSTGWHGFLYNGTTWITLDKPGASCTIPHGIDGGNIVGRCWGCPGTNGFLYNGMIWTTLVVPGASQTVPLGIDGGNIVGYYVAPPWSGFIYDGTTWTALGKSWTLGIKPYDIDGDNIVGIYYDTGYDAGEDENARGFLYDGETWTKLDAPGSTSTRVYGIDGGNIVGAYLDSTGSHGFLFVGSGGPDVPDLDIADPLWIDEADGMVLPYDSVDLKFNIFNSEEIEASNVKVAFSSLDPLISGFETYEMTVDVAGGTDLPLNNTIRIAGTANNQIMNTIVRDNGVLSLEDTIQVTLEYGEKVEEFILSPRKNNGDTLAIQYPNFSLLAGVPDLEHWDENYNYYMRQGDYDYHHPDESLVRKYAIEASRGLTTSGYPDDVSSAAYNIFLYIDCLLEDWPPRTKPEDIRLTDNDLQIAMLLEDENLIPYLEGRLAICTTQAYLVTAFARTIGIPSREVNIAIATKVVWLEFAFRFYYGFPHAGAQVWYDGEWHLLDSYFSITSLNGYLFLDDYFFKDDYLFPAYRSWFAFDRRASSDMDYGGKGHAFDLLSTGEPKVIEEWKHLKDDSRGPAWVFAMRSPVCTRVVDEQGRITGCVQGQIVEDIPSSHYTPEGTVVYSDPSDPTSGSELPETICLKDVSPTALYSLVLVGTDDGHYDLTLAFVQDDGTIIGSAIEFEILKDDKHTYDISMSSTSEILITGIPANIDIDPDTINKKAQGQWVTCYIELPEGYDVADIDVSTVVLNDVPAELKPVSLGDNDSDGAADLMVKFDQNAVQGTLDVGDDVQIVVSGKLIDGTSFEGSDTIRVIN